MDFAFTQAQGDLRASVRRYLTDRYPPERIAELSDAGHLDVRAWPELTRQGWLDPDLGPVELAVLAEESGRALHPVPWWATIGQALPVYRATGAPPPSGPVTLADGSHTCRAVPDGPGWVLDGVVPAVVDAHAAVEIVVAARTGDGVRLFAAQPTERYERPGIDPLRVVSNVDFTRARARPLVEAEPLLAAIRRRADALLAAEAVGVAGRVLELAVDYAKTRVQFGRPVGGYQAVAHLLAESYAELELARSLAYRAAGVLDAGEPDACRHGPGKGDPDEGDPDEALAGAVHATRRVAVQVCEAAIQVCGGIGVTWEFPLHRWYRRALWLDEFHTGRSDPLAAVAGVLLGG